MNLRKTAVALLAAAALVLSPAAVNAGEKNGKGGGPHSNDTCSAHGGNNSVDCSTNINVVNINGDVFDIDVKGNRFLNDNEVNAIILAVGNQINLGVCNSNSLVFNGEQCTADVLLIVQNVVLTFQNFVLGEIDVVLNPSAPGKSDFKKNKKYN